MKQNIAASVIKKLQILSKLGCMVSVIWIHKQGNTEQLGICDIGENDTIMKKNINIIPLTPSSESGKSGESAHAMELGNNAEKYFEFAEIEDSNIITNDSIIWNNEEYMIFEILPVMMGETLLCKQYKAKRVL